MASNKRYKIVITEEGQESRVVGQEWKLGAGGTPEDYGYTPEISRTQTTTRTIYTQDVEELDLIDVIKSVNGIQ